MRIVITLALWCLAAIASAQVQPLTFVAYKSTDLSGAAETVTIQKPSATVSKNIQFLSATMYCSVACTIELETAGTAATTTTLTPTALRAGSAVAEAFSASNVGNGTTVSEYVLAAGETKSIGLSAVLWSATSGLRNLTLRTDTITGTAKLGFAWSESNP
jgi:hypothetical protein